MEVEVAGLASRHGSSTERVGRRVAKVGGTVRVAAAGGVDDGLQGMIGGRWAAGAGRDCRSEEGAAAAAAAAAGASASASAAAERDRGVGPVGGESVQALVGRVPYSDPSRRTEPRTSSDV